MSFFCCLHIPDTCLIPGSARPVPGRKFRKHITGHKKSMAYRKGLRCRGSEMLWSCEVHQRMSKWWLRCQWNEMEESAHNWLNEQMSRWISESVNQWDKEPTNQSINQFIGESMINWFNYVNESTNPWISESLSQIHESRIEQFTALMKQWFNDSQNA